MIVTHEMGEREDELIEQGFTFYRQHFMFGEYLAYRRGEELRFIDWRGIYTSAELYQHLMSFWRPVRQDECDYFARIAKAGKLL